MNLYVIYAPHFVAGLEEKWGAIYSCAPILNYMHGWNVKRVLSYCKKKDWTLKYVGTH